MSPSFRTHGGLVALALSLSLTACQGGSSGSARFAAPTPRPRAAPGAPAGVSVDPVVLSFANQLSAAQTFTVRLTGTSATAPNANLSSQCGIANVVQTANPSAGTYVYTVTPTSQSGCTVRFTNGTLQAAVAITIGSFGGWGQLALPANPVLSLTPGQTTSFTVAGINGQGNPAAVGIDAGACSGIATITTTGTSYAVTAVAPGACTVTAIQNAAAYDQDIVVTPAGATPAVTLGSGAVSFISPSAPAQTVSVAFAASAAPIGIDESACDSPSPNGSKIAYVTVNGSTTTTSLASSATATVTPFGLSSGGGSCQIVFTPAHGAAATLLVSVPPGPGPY